MIRRIASITMFLVLAETASAASAAPVAPADALRATDRSALPVRRSDPAVRNLHWRLIETAHFRIHFTEGLERAASTLATAGEQIYPAVTALYRYRPEDKTDVILRDHGDFSNGFAAYFQNRIEIWATQLDFEFRSTHDWLRDVMSHEFTHMVQLGASMKAPSVLPQIYFQYFGLEPEKRTDVAEGLPNSLVSVAISTVTIPMWFAEGVAQYQTEEVRHDWWDAHRDMILRTAILSGRPLPYDDMEGFYDHDGRESEMVYDHGYSLVRYLGRTYGDSVLRDLTREMAGWGTWSLDRAMKRVTGKAGRQVYGEWLADERERYRAFVAGRQAAPAGERLELPDQPPEPKPTDVPLAITPGARQSIRETLGPTRGRRDMLRPGYYHAAPVWSPDGRRIAYVTNEGQDYTIAAVRIITVGTDSAKTAKDSYRATSTASWFPDGTRLAFSRRRRDDGNQWNYSDLVAADARGKEAEDLTRGWRATYPAVAPDGERIVFVRNESGTTNMQVLDLATDSVRALTQWTDGTQIYSPRWSPDGARIAASISRGRQRDVAVFRLDVTPAGIDTVVVESAFASPADDRDPAWLPDGRGIVFASAADGVFNLYAADLATRRVDRLTNVVGGAFTPDVAQDGRIAYASYEAEGYRIRILPASAERRQAEAWLWENPLPPDGPFVAEALPSEAIDKHVPHLQTPAILPRFGRYGDTWRVGAYAFTGDVWDEVLLLGGLWAAPSNLDYDAFLTAEIDHRFPWPVMIDLSRTVRHTAGDTAIAGSQATLSVDGINYGLNSVLVAAKPRWKSFSFDLHAMYQRFDATIDQTLHEPSGNSYYGYNYTYYHGGALGAAVSSDGILPFTTRDIAPQGLRWTVRYDRWLNRFFKDFDSGQGMLGETYTAYDYNQVAADGGYWRAMPWHEEHTLGIEGRAMLVDAPTDSFFYEGIGGIIGLRGYTYYSLQGRKTAWARAAYRLPLPLVGSPERKIGPVYADKIYIAGFAEAGRVWRDSGQYPNAWVRGWKRDVGIEVRADLFAFYGYPSRVSFSWARALDTAPGMDRNKYYLTVLFGYL